MYDGATVCGGHDRKRPFLCGLCEVMRHRSLGVPGGFFDGVCFENLKFPFGRII